MNTSLRTPRFTLVWVGVLAMITGCTASPGGPLGAVAADHPLAAEAGAEVLRAGGNAVDAAVATSLALSVVRPDACGIGGGGFMVIHLPDDPNHGRVSTAIDYREICPAAIGPDTYANWGDPEASRRGGRAVAIPGTIAGLTHALNHYGTMERARVFAPAIRLAEQGFAADAHHVRTAQSLVSYFNDDPIRRTRFPLVWLRFMREGQIQIGDRIELPEQAAILRLIADTGPDAFYQGSIADSIVASASADGGVLTHTDLSSYRVRETAPVRHRVGPFELMAMPPPSSGGVAVAQILDLAYRLEIDVPTTGWTDAASAHLLAECMKHAFADRARYMADPAFAHVPVDHMLNHDVLQAIARRIDRTKTMPAPSYGSRAPLTEDGGTSHLSVIDAWGGAVACTETINLAFGSLVGVRGAGFCLNDQMDDFTTVRGQRNAFGLVQSDANLPEPGKRPLSSMSPTILVDHKDQVVAVAGASGGPRIITSTAQVLLRRLRANASATQAVRAPRLHHQWLPDRLDLEPGGEARETLASQLAVRGHAVSDREQVGAVQALFRDAHTSDIDGAADHRKGGAVRTGRVER
ncbi:MAG: gamma-glutamyltransferase [Planctomycetota bacterium]